MDGKKITGLRAVCLHHCYRLGYLPKKRQRKPLSPEAREAWRRIDRTTAQITLIDHAHLHDLGAVKQFIQTTDAEIMLLTDYRESLRGKLRSCHEAEEKAVLTAKRDDCTKALGHFAKIRKPPRASSAISGKSEKPFKLKSVCGSKMLFPINAERENMHDDKTKVRFCFTHSGRSISHAGAAR